MLFQQKHHLFCLSKYKWITEEHISYAIRIGIVHVIRVKEQLFYFIVEPESIKK